MNRLPILVCGGGIAGLTLGLCLKRAGLDARVIERAPALRTEGYMMDFFGTGWDVASRLGLEDALRAVRYPIDDFSYVDGAGKPFIHMRIGDLRRSLGGKYVYLRRQDLESILYDRARAEGVDIRFGANIRAIDQQEDRVEATFEDGTREAYSLLIGADGVHSQVRELAFGPYEKFARYLGYYVAGFHAAAHPKITNAVLLREETNRIAAFYPTSNERMDATLAWRTPDLGFVLPAARLPTVRAAFRGTDWITGEVLAALPNDAPIFFDSVTQIDMPTWHAGRVALIGDAAGCLTLLAGQGSHMAMAGAYVLAHELATRDDHVAAFVAFERTLRGSVQSKQREARRLARVFIPSERSHAWLRRLVIGAMFSRPGIALTMASFGSQSVLHDYPTA